MIASERLRAVSLIAIIVAASLGAIAGYVFYPAIHNCVETSFQTFCDGVR